MRLFVDLILALDYKECQLSVKIISTINTERLSKDHQKKFKNYVTKTPYQQILRKFLNSTRRKVTE